MQKLNRAQELLGTSDLAKTLDELATFYNKSKDPSVEKKRDKSTPPAECVENVGTEISTPPAECAKKSRYVAAKVKREVYREAGAQCTYIDANSGKRCSERTHLELDHIKPYATGGDQSAENLRIRCRAHNNLWAKDVFGREFMREKIKNRPCKKTGFATGSN